MRTRLTLALAMLLAGIAIGAFIADAPPAAASLERTGPTVQYLEIVTSDVEAVVAALTSALGVEFSGPDAGLGGARTVALAGGGLLGVRAPLRETEEPVVRPYFLVSGIDAAVAAVVRAGGQVAHSPLEIPGHGTFAIYHQSGNDYGLWQR